MIDAGLDNIPHHVDAHFDIRTDQLVGGRSYVFLQDDDAPAHSAKDSQNWLANLSDFCRSRPDCNAPDYNMWETCERAINRPPPKHYCGVGFHRVNVIYTNILMNKKELELISLFLTAF